MTACFADSFFFLALLNVGDDALARAVSLAGTPPGRLVTTAWVLTEVADAMAAPANRSMFVGFLASLRANPHVEVAPTEAALFDRGLELYARRPDKAWSLTDRISFVVMTERGLRDVHGPVSSGVEGRSRGADLREGGGRVVAFPKRPS